MSDLEKNIIQSNVSQRDSVDDQLVSKETSSINQSQEQPLSDDSSSDHRVFHSRGVDRIEAVKASMDVSKRGKWARILLAISLLICAWSYSLDSSTTYNYSPYATSSFNHHSMISTLAIATNLMSSVCKPILAKIADITSRPTTYVLVLALYVLGYIIVASSSTISAYIIGEVFVAIGSSGIDLMNTIIAADITPLKYRGLLFGILSTPYLITT